MQNTTFMKKSIKKILNNSIRKFRIRKETGGKFLFSSYKEDFVITEQEEREGGFFGRQDPKMVPS